MSPYLARQHQSFPRELTEQPQWVCWRWEERDGKRTKPPVQPETGERIDCTNPSSWLTYDDAVGQWMSCDVDGIGFVFNEGDELAGVDLDDCRDADTGKIEPKAQEIIDNLNSYTEVSPSGTGVKIFLKGVLPQGGKRKGTVEMYDHGRFFTVTGCHLDDTPKTIEHRQAELASLHADTFGSGKSASSAPASSFDADDVDDEVLIRRAMSVTNGDAFKRLWEGDTGDYASQSEADLALCSHLAFWTKYDRDAVDRLFRLSGLMRDKWDKKHHHDGRTYGDGTIETSLSDQSETPVNGAPTGWPVLAQEALYGLAGDIVTAIEPHTEADPAALLMDMLVTFGVMVGDGPHYQVEEDRHCVNMFVVNVGDTSKGRKGTAWGRIRRLFEGMAPNWSGDNEASGLSSGEGLIWAVRDPIVQQEPVRDSKRLITGYQQVTTDPGVNDKRLLVVEQEFASVLKTLSREGNTLSPTMREGWDHGDLRTLAKNSPAQATNPHIGIIGHITDQELERYLTATEMGNGFANRILWVCTRRSKLLPNGGGKPDLTSLKKRLTDALAFGQQAQELTRDVEADRLWRKEYPKLTDGRGGLVGAVTSRAEAQVVRLSCLYALFNKSTVITKEHMMAALAVWDYAEHSARYIFGTATGDAVLDKVAGALATNGSMTRTQISKVLDRHVSSARIDAVLQKLRQQGKARYELEETDGRSREVWHAVLA